MAAALGADGGGCAGDAGGAAGGAEAGGCVCGRDWVAFLELRTVQRMVEEFQNTRRLT